MSWFDIIAPVLSAALAGVLCFKAGVRHEQESAAKERLRRRQSITDRTITSGSLNSESHSRVSTARVRRARRS